MQIEKNFENRWQIVYGAYEGLEAKALNSVYKTVSRYVTYTPVANSCQEITIESLCETNPILIGTRETNPYIARLADEKRITVPNQDEGYAIFVTKSVFNPEKQMVVIAGNDAKGALYGAIDFENFYLSTKFYKNKLPEFTTRPLIDFMPEFERISSPAIKNRGLWTWGHAIYDDRAYLDHMAALKLNTITIWNDFAPINAKEIVAYAHSLGIKVIWGYSWGWLENSEIGFDIGNEASLKEWVNLAIEIYEQQYATLGGDGIYFQTFTETTERCHDGQVIAEKAANWVNTISRAMLERYPDLEIQFGLHATSVCNDLKFIKEVDPRVSIVWEDAGAFPFDYMPQNVRDFDKTVEFTKQICNLRGDDDRFGAVLKGLVCLDWGIFEHQKGKFLAGDRVCSPERRQMIDKLWRYSQAGWLQNADKAYELIRAVKEAKNGQTIISALVEDSLFEETIPYPVALLAAMLWDTSAELKDLIGTVSLMPAVKFM